MKSKFVQQSSLYLMMAPSVLLLVIFSYVPMAGIVIAFENYKPAFGFLRSDWVGMQNFVRLFTDPNFIRTIWNSFYISVLKLVAGMFVPVVFALLLNEVRCAFFKRTVQTIVYLPHFISWVLLAGILINILSPTDGIVNQFLGLFGIKPIFFLASNRWFVPSLVMTDIWKEFGFGTILFLAAITVIDPQLYEAAIADGAGRWKQTLHITIPGITSTFILVTTLSLGSVMNAGFDQIFNLMTPPVMDTSDIIGTYVYRIGIKGGNFSSATAAGLFQSVVSFVLIATSYRLARRFSGYRIF